ncbi:MAG: CRISPR-associated helicase Cas3' [Vicinamibacteria bacterium]
MPPTYFAHSGSPSGVWHPLSEHLSSVGDIAARFALARAWADEARLAGYLHDLGKYGDLFQARLRGQESGLDHWSTGALVALTAHRSVGAALAVEGHHIGLQRAAATDLRTRFRMENLTTNHPLGLRLSGSDAAELLGRATADGISFSSPATGVIPLLAGSEAWSPDIAKMLDVRMLFSCLVDADFLDTEAHFSRNATGKVYRDKGQELDAPGRLNALERYMAKAIRGRGESSAAVSSVRAELWDAVNAAADRPTGLFSLTAPTGSGKTLAMLQFALKHAAANKLDRVVLAVPFLAIVEQTAQRYKEVFANDPANTILEHHSLAGLGAERARADAEGSRAEETERQRRQLAENWDAPIVLTTNVQLLESLFSNRPSACRKLHNLARTVILFDEAQTIPQHLAIPTLSALSHLAREYGSSVVVATATQPAFDGFDGEVRKHSTGGWMPHEVVPGNREMFRALARLRPPEWPEGDSQESWESLAADIRQPQSRQSLCVVNLKRHSTELHGLVSAAEAAFYLSTNLCTAHRRQVLATVRSRLLAGESCRLISTQCVEAGVDLDFPVVYRAMGPLDAIAQAAGRCNREGRATEGGRFKVFQPPLEGALRKSYPNYSYYQAAEVTRSMLVERGALNIEDPQLFRDYYQRLYNLTRLTEQSPELRQAITSLDFPEIAKLYRLIDEDAIQVMVPWEGAMDAFNALREEGLHGIRRGWIQKAQQLAVSVYRPRPDHPSWDVLIPVQFPRGGASDEWFILQDRPTSAAGGSFYNSITGLRLPNDQQIMIA